MSVVVIAMVDQGSQIRSVDEAHWSPTGYPLEPEQWWSSGSPQTPDGESE